MLLLNLSLIKCYQHLQAALADLRISKLDITMGEEGVEPELELVDDPEQETTMDTSRVPVIVTVSQVCCVYCLWLMQYVLHVRQRAFTLFASCLHRWIRLLRILYND